jgi:hypothetical protein
MDAAGDTFAAGATEIEFFCKGIAEEGTERSGRGRSPSDDLTDFSWLPMVTASFLSIELRMIAGWSLLVGIAGTRGAEGFRSGCFFAKSPPPSFGPILGFIGTSSVGCGAGLTAGFSFGRGFTGAFCQGFLSAGTSTGFGFSTGLTLSTAVGVGC